MKDCKLVTIISFLILIIFTSPIFASVIVNTSRGKVRGFETNSILNGTKYYSFLGIPYAKPPIKNLRFQVILLKFFNFNVDFLFYDFEKIILR